MGRVNYFHPCGPHSRMNSRLIALREAMAQLPIEDGTWSISAAILEAAGLTNQESLARQYLLKFAHWAHAGGVNQLLDLPPESFEATDFNDYYKIVMSRVQLLYQKARAMEGDGDEPRHPFCCFQTQVRRRPVYTKGGKSVTLGCFDAIPRVGYESSWTAAGPAFRKALLAAGSRKFKATTLRRLISNRSPKAEAIEAALEPLNDEWIERLAGSPLFTLLDPGVEFSGSGAVEVRIKEEEGSVVLLAEGPWFRVTFVETVLLQTMAQFMTDMLLDDGDDTEVNWCREALITFALTAHHVQDTLHAPGRGSMAFFSGRRAPNPQFHLLQVRGPLSLATLHA